jgi:hypothetical protein
MARITVDVNDAWLEAARLELGTSTKVATINAALETIALRRRARDVVAAMDSISLEYRATHEAWGYGGGRDLGALVDRARAEEAESPAESA